MYCISYLVIWNFVINCRYKVNEHKFDLITEYPEHHDKADLLLKSISGGLFKILESFLKRLGKQFPYRGFWLTMKHPSFTAPIKAAVRRFKQHSFHDVLTFYLNKLSRTITSHKNLDTSKPLEIVVHILDPQRARDLDLLWKDRQRKLAMLNSGKEEPMEIDDDKDLDNLETSLDNKNQAIESNVEERLAQLGYRFSETHASQENSNSLIIAILDQLG